MAVNLGDISFGLGPDTRRLEAARQAIIRFGAQVDKAAKSQAEGARQTEAALRRQEKAMLNAVETTKKLASAVRSIGGHEGIINHQTKALHSLIDQLQHGPASAHAFQRAMTDFDTQVNRVTRSVTRQQDVIRGQARAAKEAAAAAASQEAAQARLERSFHSAEMAVLKYNSAVERLNSKQAASFAGRADAHLTSFKNAMLAANGSLLQSQRAHQVFQSAMMKTNNELGNFKKASAITASGLGGLETGLRRLSDVAILLHGPLGGVSARLGLISSVADKVSLSTAAMVTGFSAGVFAFGAVTKGALDAARAFQKVEVSLMGLTGSQAEVNKVMGFVSGIADRAGASLINTARQYTRFLAASKDTNLEGEKTKIIFENIVFAAQKLGSSQEELEGTLRAVEQIMSKGQVQAEELRGQLGDRLPGAVQIMAQSLGIGTAELNKMMKQGKLTSDVLVGFSETLTKRLGVDTTKPIENISAAEGRLNNAWLRLNKTVADSTQVTQAYTNVLGGLTSGLNYISQNFDSFIHGLTLAGEVIAGVFLSLYGPAVIRGLATLTTGLFGVGKAMGAVAVAASTLRLGGVAASLGALGSALGILAGPLGVVAAVAGFQLLKPLFTDSAAAADAATKSVDMYAMSMSEVDTLVRDLKISQMAYEDAIGITSRTGKSSSDIIIASTKREFEAKKSLLDLEIKRQKAIQSTRQQEINALQGVVASKGPQQFDPRSVVGSDRGLAAVMMDNSAAIEEFSSKQKEARDDLQRLRAESDLAAGAIEKLEEAYKSTFKQGRIQQDEGNKGYLALDEDRIKEFGKQLDNLKVTTEGVSSLFKVAQEDLATLGQEYGTAAEQVKYLAEAQAEMSKGAAIESAARTIDMLASNFANMQEIFSSSDMQGGIASLTQGAADISRSLGIALPDAQALNQALSDATQTDNLWEMQDALMSAFDAMQKVFEEQGKLTPAQQQFTDEVLNTLDQVNTLIGAVDSVTSATYGAVESANALAGKWAEVRANQTAATVEFRDLMLKEDRASKARIDGLRTEGITSTEDSRLSWDRGINLTYEERMAIIKQNEREARKGRKGGGGGTSEKEANRVALAMKNAEDSIRETSGAYENLYLPDGLRQWADLQLGINKSVEDFRDKLTKAEVPATTVNQLTDDYAEKLRLFREGEFNLQFQADMWAELADVMSSNMDDAFGGMIENAMRTGDAFRGLRDIGMTMAEDLIKTFLQLAAINPLKNMLFGGMGNGLPFPTLGGGGIGGVNNGATQGNWISSLINFAFGAKNGMAVTPGGRRFAQGGIVRGPTNFMSTGGPGLMGEAGPEAIVPLSRGKGGKLGISMNGMDFGDAQQTGPSELHVHIDLKGAKGDKEIASLVRGAVQQGLAAYDKNLPNRVNDINRHPKKR